MVDGVSVAADENKEAIFLAHSTNSRRILRVSLCQIDRVKEKSIGMAHKQQRSAT